MDKFASSKSIAILETFDEFLNNRGISIPTSEQEKKENNEPELNSCVIYGMDYAELKDNVEEIIKVPPGGTVGWICPVCGAGMSPYATRCTCRDKFEITC